MKFVAKKPGKSFARGQWEIKRGLSRLVATRLPRQAQAQEIPLGRFHAAPVVVRCAIGRTGIRRDKREGDRATPGGAFRLLGGLFRADRVLRKAWGTPMRPAGPSDGWCDDPESALYNRRVALPCRASHEKLWRADRLYDLVIVVDFNIRPRRKNRGSAIFLHCARPDFAPTSGCIALRFDDLRRLLPRL
ncbi:MAG TPA: L,D-transpeptidase family protein, partial [Methylocella sp.]|nr:L,D-transpeptidase family protein [Methylocella sp.]